MDDERGPPGAGESPVATEIGGTDNEQHHHDDTGRDRPGQRSQATHDDAAPPTTISAATCVEPVERHHADPTSTGIPVARAVNSSSASGAVVYCPSATVLLAPW